MSYFRNMCYFCIVIYQTYRVIDLLINNNRMSSAIAQILSEKQRTSRLRKLFPLASEFKDKVVFDLIWTRGSSPNFIDS
jgi:hypothetical protein